MTASTRTPPVGNEGNGIADERRADGGDDSNHEYGDHPPSLETYRRRALQGAARDVSTQAASVIDLLVNLETRLADGTDPTPNDLLRIQHVLAGTTEALVPSLEELAVESEPRIVAELRRLAIETNGALLYAAHTLADGRRLHPGPYATGTDALERTSTLYALIEEHGGVSHADDPPLTAPIDRLDAEISTLDADAVDSATGQDEERR